MNWDFLFDALVTNISIAFLIMFLALCVYIVQKKAVILDVAWAFSFAAIAVATFTLSESYYLRRLLFLFLAISWSGRLTGYLFLRYMRAGEDARYVALKKRFYTILWLFPLQAILVTILCWPFILIASNNSPTIAVSEWIGAFIIVVGAVLESIADWQLYTFRSLASNQGRVCKEGLWKYSRHPNYFFELVVWVGFFLFAVDAPLGFTALISPVLMWYLLTVVSGIPLSEKAALASRGEGYIKYQQETSTFIPRFW